MRRVWCGENEAEVNNEALRKKAKEILSGAELVRKGGRIIVSANGKKVGKLRFEAPLEELEVESAWKSPRDKGRAELARKVRRNAPPEGVT